MKINQISPIYNSNFVSRGVKKSQVFLGVPKTKLLAEKAISETNSIMLFQKALAPSDIFKLNKQLDIDKIKNMNISNLRVISDSVLSGATFENRAVTDLKNLKQNGIKTIIDFRAESLPIFKERCQKMGFKYHNFVLDDVSNFRNPDYFKRSKNDEIHVKDEFVDKLKKFFDILNTQKTYMGCQYGIDRTNLGIVMNYLLNTKSANTPEILTWPEDKKKTVLNKNVKFVKKLYKHLTQEQKQRLNLDNAYRNEIDKRIYMLVQKNHSNQGGIDVSA